MTFNEVMALSKDDLRVKAAELMGWKKPKPGNAGSLFGAPALACDEYRWRKPCGQLGLDPPNYPDDIAAAWELVDFMGFKRGLDLDLSGGPLLWEAEFMPVPDGGASLEIGLVRASNAPLAITRVFVLAMGQEASVAS